MNVRALGDEYRALRSAITCRGSVSELEVLRACGGYGMHHQTSGPPRAKGRKNQMSYASKPESSTAAPGT